MEQDSLWSEFAALPPEAQREVSDFIAFLRARYARSRPDKKSKQTKLTDEAFIGMWRDRQDLNESTAWVRALREREW